MTKSFQTCGEVGGGGLPQLAPDLTWPSSLFATSGYQQIVGINAVGSLTTALSLTGKFSISLLELADIIAESITIKLTIDGVVLWDDSFFGTILIKLLGSLNTNDSVAAEIQCESSFLLEIQTTTDNAVTLNYLARPIL